MNTSLLLKDVFTIEFQAEQTQAGLQLLAQSSGKPGFHGICHLEPLY